MSALVNTSSTSDIKQSLLANKARLAESISDISVTTRIDYNLRFTKQAVLVVANNAEQYSPLASQFLVTLSNESPNNNQHTSQDSHINVAFVSASTKLNDIQIRCRLIEQLFVNALFDPEESLAVSALRFANLQSEAITIVIDHAHALSLQIKYELSQLVNLAKKSKLTINVVLFGLTEAAQQLSENKSLFKGKMVLIDADTGQVLSYDDKKIAIERKAQTLGLWQKLTLLGAMSLIAGALIWLYLLIVEDINQQADIQTSLESDDIPRLENIAKTRNDTAIRQMQKKEKTSQSKISPNTNVIHEQSKATSGDVLQALLGNATANQAVLAPAQAGDVLQALEVVDGHSEAEGIIVLDVKAPSENQLSEEGVLQESRSDINPNYYQAKAIEHKQGYVIQIAGFADVKLSKRFIEQNSTEGLHSYQRYLADKDFTVVTSKVYATKAEAKSAISLLPAQLIARKPWLKSISSVINEINTFKR